jgi:hypothetical protein
MDCSGLDCCSWVAGAALAVAGTPRDGVDLRNGKIIVAGILFIIVRFASARLPTCSSPNVWRHDARSGPPT